MRGGRRHCGARTRRLRGGSSPAGPVTTGPQRRWDARACRPAALHRVRVIPRKAVLASNRILGQRRTDQRLLGSRMADLASRPRSGWAARNATLGPLRRAARTTVLRGRSPIDDRVRPSGSPAPHPAPLRMSWDDCPEGNRLWTAAGVEPTRATSTASRRPSTRTCTRVAGPKMHGSSGVPGLGTGTTPCASLIRGVVAVHQQGRGHPRSPGHIALQEREECR
jgi:hypothetical protein